MTERVRYPSDPPILIKSVVVHALFPETVRDPAALELALRGIADERFYDAVEFYYEGDPSGIPAIRSALEAFRASPVFLGGAYLKQHRLSLGSLAAPRRRHAIDVAKRLVDTAHAFGCGKLLVPSGETLPTREERDASYGLLVESLGELCRYAERATKGAVRITLEPFNDRGEPYYLIGPSSLAKRLADEVAAQVDNFELTYDFSHMLQLGEDPLESLSVLSPHVGHIHLANCYLADPSHPMYGDKHPPFDYPGGEATEERIRAFVRDALRLGRISRSPCTVGVEVITPEGEDGRALYERTTALFRRVATDHRDHGEEVGT